VVALRTSGVGRDAWVDEGSGQPYNVQVADYNYGYDVEGSEPLLPGQLANDDKRDDVDYEETR